jgi:CheY-like chemotaxis protein
VAEDNLINQQVVSGILKRAGYAVDVADDGLEAVQKAEPKLYDIMLMDLQMPYMAGIQAAAVIRQIPGFQHTPIIAMTAHAMQRTHEECPGRIERLRHEAFRPARVPLGRPALDERAFGTRRARLAEDTRSRRGRRPAAAR